MKTAKTKKLKLAQQAGVLLENPKNLKKLVIHVLEYGVSSDESLCIDELNLDCFFPKKQYEKLFYEEEFEEEDYVQYVAENYASVLKPENWCVILDSVHELVMKAVSSQMK